ncbi:uncharacterized protein LOC21394697 [Morus notabilis]|uniref:uncharacterized protein LOC21394697 n=1 Tax=Morus notabilis TaxID=981085 RepID=UPI000CED7BEC|nr:uncharacterized protein LOC21394697 [Morus notabilis]
MNMQESPSILMGSPLFSPSSDERFWSALRNRIDGLLEERNSKTPTLDRTLNMNVGDSGRAKRLKEDALLLIRGFDSVAHTLFQLSNNLDTALQGANDLAKPPTLIEIFHNSLKKPESESESKEENSGKQQNEGGETNKGLKRKYDHCSDDQGEKDSKKEKEQSQKDGKLKKAKNLAISMATKAASHARELKSIKSDLCFMQERCSLLEEENIRLRDGFSKGIRPEEDDLVRLQLEALLTEKSRLANENANLIRENQCLNQLVEYHQLTSQEDFSNASYEQVIQGLCLDFSSPPPPIPEEEATDEHHDCDAAVECFETPVGNLFGFSDGLNECDDHH